jgi:hypothetical protein
VSHVPGRSVVRVSFGECVEPADVVAAVGVDGAAAVMVGVRVVVTVTVRAGVVEVQAASSAQPATPMPHRTGRLIMAQTVGCVRRVGGATRATSTRSF